MNTLATAAIFATSTYALDNDQVLSRLVSAGEAEKEASKAMHDSIIKLFDLRPIHLDNDTNKTEQTKTGEDGKAQKK